MKCRHCGNDLNLPFLDLGSAPPSNAYLTEDSLISPEIWFPLRILVCNNCWLVQTQDHAGREDFFTDDYAYFSSISTTWLEHAEKYVQFAIDRFSLSANSFVIEIAANDGYLLQFLQRAGVTCLGIEPTISTANAARSKGLEIIDCFFGLELAKQLVKDGRRADLMIANNVLAHVPDINDFVSGFTHLLKPQGVATFEFPHLLKMVQENQFDTAYHEHFSYFSLNAVQSIFSANGLTVFDVEKLTTHGGSLRVFAQKSESGKHQVSQAVTKLLQIEEQAGVKSPEFYVYFQKIAEKVKDDLVSFIIDIKRNGLKVAAYGAAAKGNTLLNFAGIRPDLLPYVVDKNPAKQNKWMPGSRIPIVDESRLKCDQPDYIIILPWNLSNEVIEQLSYVRAWGGKFVLAVPELKIQ